MNTETKKPVSRAAMQLAEIHLLLANVRRQDYSTIDTAQAHNRIDILADAVTQLAAVIARLVA